MTRALVFDCGGVLFRPVNGDWCFPPEAGEFLAGVPAGALAEAKRAAAGWLDESRRIDTLEEECRLREGFFRALPFGWARERAKELARQTTYAPERYQPYPDVAGWLARWQGTYKLGLLSDAMPSMKIAMAHHGLMRFFGAAVASCEVGALKPDPRMYAAVLDLLGVAPGEAIFVDDLPRNLAGAQAAGMRAVRMARPVYVNVQYAAGQAWNGETITCMAELDRLI